MKIIQEKEDVTFLNNTHFGIFLEGRMNIMKDLPGLVVYWSRFEHRTSQTRRKNVNNDTAMADINIRTQKREAFLRSY